jgi:ABC-2 type transport system permease protein
MLEHRFALDHFTAAVALDAVYLAFAVILFLYAFQIARRRGSLMKTGE